MSGFDEYYNIEKMPEDFLKELENLKNKMKKELPRRDDNIEIIQDSWPEKNGLRVYFKNLSLNELAMLDENIQKLLKKYDLKFELTSSGFICFDD